METNRKVSIFDLIDLTAYHNDIVYVDYQTMVDAIGEPQYLSGSSDGKTQKEWKFVTDEGISFTIYDWKEYNRDVTDGEPVEWHIGHKGGADTLNAIKHWFEQHGLHVTKDKMYQFLR